MSPTHSHAHPIVQPFAFFSFFLLHNLKFKSIPLKIEFLKFLTSDRHNKTFSP